MNQLGPMVCVVSKQYVGLAQRPSSITAGTSVVEYRVTPSRRTCTKAEPSSRLFILQPPI